MNTLLILLTISLFVLQTLALKLVRTKQLSEKLLTNCAFTFLAAAALGILAIFFPQLRTFSAPTILCGIAFGVLFALTILFYLSAISCGPLSYTSFYLSASMLLPAGAGILFFREKLSVTLLIAICFFLAAFYCLNVTGEDKSAGRKWQLFCFLTFLCNGSSGIVQKTHQYLSSGSEAAGLMLVGFSAATLCYGIAFLWARKTEGTPADTWPLKQNLLPICLLAIASLGGNLLLTFLAGHLDGSYLFPLVQGSIILGVTLCSVLFFHERLTLRGKLGILAGTIGIILINL